MPGAQGSDGLGKYGEGAKKNISRLVEVCILGGAAFKDKDGKCDLAALYYHVIANDKDILTCSHRGTGGACSLGREKMSQGEVDELVKLVLEEKKRMANKK